MAYERGSSQAAAKVDLEAPGRSVVLHPCCRHKPNVCHPDKAVLVAACKVDLELARKVLAHGVAEEELCDRHRIRSGVKVFVGTYAGKVAAHDVSDGVAACFPGRKAGLDKAPHGLAHIFQLYPMELDVLPGGNMGRSNRERFRKACNFFNLVRSYLAAWHLYSDHAVLHVKSRAVCSVLQAEAPEIVL